MKRDKTWPAAQIETLRAALRRDKLVPAGEGLAIRARLPHGRVALGMAPRIGLDAFARGPERRRNLALALIAARTKHHAAGVSRCLLGGVNIKRSLRSARL